MNQLYSLVEANEIKRINVQLPTVINGTTIPEGATGLDEFGLYPQVTTPIAEYDTATQRLVGPTYDVTDVEVTLNYSVEDIPQSELDGKHNSEVLAEIAKLEQRQPRAVREALLGMDGAVDRLQTLEDDIAALRATLK